MPLSTDFSRQLGLAHPIIQAPLAGGSDTPALVAAVSTAGGLGSVGCAYLSPTQILDVAREVRARTDRPFGLNLFSPLPVPSIPDDLEPVLEQLRPFYRELGLPDPDLAAPSDPYPAQFQAVLEARPAVFSFTFALIPEADIRAAHDRGILVLGTATNVEEAKRIEAAGADAIVCQGSEAGGHRGTFGVSMDAGLVGTMALVPQVADAVTIPVVASGGIMDGRGIAAALTLGASAVQMGTAFLTCDEAGTPEAYKQAILAAQEGDTRLTRAFSGRMARGIENRFLAHFASREETILPFPLQNALTRPLRTAAGKASRAEFLSLWAGQALRLARRQPAAELITALMAETEAAIRSLTLRVTADSADHDGTPAG